MSAADLLSTKTKRERDGEAERDRLLDAARVELCQHGMRHVSIAAIARRAGVSQPTLYRRCGTKNEIVSAVVYRDVFRVFTVLAVSTSALPTAEERLVEAWVIGVRESRTNELVKALRDLDSEEIATRLLGQEDSGRLILRSTLAGILNDATIDAVAAGQAVELIVRIIASLLLSPTPLLSLDTDEQARAFAERYLVPIVEAARHGPL
ncbi:TetR/AcrR family transcriptional regulator [Mycolicibacter kumamotonensis]|uniref:HTH tetR-type domain-containing protein n=1 Tax=Mycolicibacter kumamotonensis TaxID=354243 RepID=A0A1B8SI21_9MYCO|nr:TetR/AcrR family transcriptional regulator [Mycolicibacter kumamotonensis]OBY32382.1 hypothetical protein ACT18_07795 [Mycolicibacter kumamotonensis]